jgi:hypothetical protein
VAVRQPNRRARGERSPRTIRWYARGVPIHHDRSRVREARISGLAITLSVAALILVLVYQVGGLAQKVVVEVVAIPGQPTLAISPRP